MNKFKNKYTIQSARMGNYDYSQNGIYFVTICTKDKEKFLGEIENGKMILSDVGKIIYDEWLRTSIIRSNVILDEWVIMPNHFHAIIEIRNKLDSINVDVEMSRAVKTPHDVETPRRGVSTMGMKNSCGGYNPNWKPNSLGSIINQFKSVCTKKIWKSGYIYFHWQARFYDRVIRNEKERELISKIIFVLLSENFGCKLLKTRHNISNIIPHFSQFSLEIF